MPWLYLEEHKIYESIEKNVGKDTEFIEDGSEFCWILTTVCFSFIISFQKLREDQGFTIRFVVFLLELNNIYLQKIRDPKITAFFHQNFLIFYLFLSFCT